MTRLYSKIRFHIPSDINDDNNVRSLLIGEILWNISQIETEISLALSSAIGLTPGDSLQTLRDLNFDSKIRILEAKDKLLQITFPNDHSRKAHYKDLRKIKDARNRLAHGVIFEDEKGKYMNIPNREKFARHRNSLSLEIKELRELLSSTQFVVTAYMLSRTSDGTNQLKRTSETKPLN